MSFKGELALKALENKTLDMRKIFISFLFALCTYNFSFADEKVGSYYMSQFDKSYDILISSVDNGKFSFFVFAHPAEMGQKIAFCLESADVEHFKSEFQTVKEKYLEWTKTAKDNNITDFDKDFDTNFKPVNVFFYGSKWYISDKKYIRPYFKVTKDGEYLVVIHMGKVTAYDNEYIDSEGFYIAFKSINEINNFLKELDVDKVLNKEKEKESRNDLFK